MLLKTVQVDGVNVHVHTDDTKSTYSNNQWHVHYKGTCITEGSCSGCPFARKPCTTEYVRSQIQPHLINDFPELYI